MGKKSLFATTTPEPPKPDGPPPTERQPVAETRFDTASDFASAVPPRGTPPKRDFKNTLITAVIFTGSLLLMVAIASIINNNHYFINEKNGAVEIWQGDFTPTGRNRLIILHGTEWTGEVKDDYTRDDVFGFARNIYLEKARTLLNDPGPPDDERIAGYLTRTIALLPETIRDKNQDQMDQIDRYLKEAAILNDSEEKLAVELARQKLEAAHHAIAGLPATADKTSAADPTKGKVAPNPQAHQE